jgi:hypothetical protein
MNHKVQVFVAVWIKIAIVKALHITVSTETIMLQAVFL